MDALISGAREAARGLCTRRSLVILAFFLFSLLGADSFRERLPGPFPVAFADQDNTHVSRMLGLMLGANRELDLEIVGDVDPDTLQGWVDAGVVRAAVLVPEGFTAAIKRGGHADLVVAADLRNLVVGRNIQKAVSRTVATVSAGVQIQVLRKLGQSPEAALSRVAPVQLDESDLMNPGLSYTIYVVPGLFFSSVNLLLLIWVATPRPGRGFWATVGSDAVHALGAVGLSLFGLWVVLPFEGVDVGSPWVILPFGVLWILGTIAMARSFRLLPPIVARLRGKNADLEGLFGLEAGVFVGAISMMLSGLTWPRESFPPLLRLAASLVPFTPYSVGLRAALGLPLHLATLGPELGWIAAVSGGWAVISLVGVAIFGRRP